MDTPDNYLDIHNDGSTLLTLSNMWNVSFENALFVCIFDVGEPCLHWSIIERSSRVHGGVLSDGGSVDKKLVTSIIGEIILLRIQYKLHILTILILMILVEWKLTTWEIDSCAVASPITAFGAKPWSIPTATP